MLDVGSGRRGWRLLFDPRGRATRDPVDQYAGACVNEWKAVAGRDIQGCKVVPVAAGCWDDGGGNVKQDRDTRTD